MTAAESPAGIRSRVLEAVVPLGSLLLLAAMLTLVLSAAGKTFGYDFEAYASAARRFINGQSLYDPAVSAAGGFAVYLYPPPFAVAIAPLLLLPESTARVVWVLAMGACLPLGSMLLPIRRSVRWAVICMGAVSWPFLYSVKLGQVGPLLFVLFAVAWRSLDRERPLGASMAIAVLVKVQPAILVVWAAVSGRWRAAVVAVGVCVGVSAIATALTGVGVWADYAALLGRVSSAVTTPNNCSPGAVLYQAGLPEAVATTAQWASTALAAAAVLLIWRRGGAEVGLMGAIVCSQLMTPLLWDHYAMILLLPTAWFLERGRIWAAVIPLVGWISIFDTQGVWLARASIPLTFFGVLGLLLLEAHRERRKSAPGGAEPGAPSARALPA